MLSQTSSYFGVLGKLTQLNRKLTSELALPNLALPSLHCDQTALEIVREKTAKQWLLAFVPWEDLHILWIL